MAEVKIISMNCHGLADKRKRFDVLNYLKAKDAMIYCLQDTHLVKDFDYSIEMEWSRHCLFSYLNSQSRGVTILFNNKFDYTIHDVKTDSNGNYVVIDITFNDKRFTLCSIYGPNNDSPDFYYNIKKIIQSYGNANYILCGDWNMVIDPKLDTYNYLHINNPKARKVMLEIIKDDLGLIDPWRSYNENVKRFTWRQPNPLKQSRLDFFLVSEELMNFIENSEILPGYRSDHSITTINFVFNDLKKGKSFWKFNNSLLKDINYINVVKTKIKEVINQYVATPHNPDTIDQIHRRDLNFQIGDQLFLDVLLLEIRGITISFSSFKKKENHQNELKLQSEIQALERQHNILDQNLLELLDSKNTELQNLRKIKMDGAMLRSRANWLDTGEKPSAYFLSLEKRNSVNKEINRLIGEDGNVKSTKDDIMKECYNFYATLYGSKDHPNITLQDFLNFDNIARLNETQKQQLEGEIDYDELLAALKNMKNNKSPGLDGFTAEFFKVFFTDLSWFLLRSINEAFKFGSLSTTQNRGVITLIPKSQKPRHLLKNWRPISLLNTTYKMASSCIAQRLKKALPF